MQIRENIISDGHGYLDASYIVIHETANPGATAKNHVDYWSGYDTYAVHYVADWYDVIYHCVPDNRLCWQVGNGNKFVIGIELCHAENQSDFEKVWSNGVEWAAFMLKKHGWSVDRLISHNDCTNWWGGSDHTDPLSYFRDYGKSWEQFKREVDERLSDENMTDEQIQKLAKAIYKEFSEPIGDDAKKQWGSTGKGSGKSYRNGYNLMRWYYDLLVDVNAKLDRIIKKMGA